MRKNIDNKDIATDLRRFAAQALPDLSGSFKKHVNSQRNGARLLTPAS